MTAGTRESVALASIGLAEPPTEGTVLQIGGETWTLRYVPTLSRLGMTSRSDFRGRPLNQILLRDWNERVFLHEVLHVVLDQRLLAYHAGAEWTSTNPNLPAPREKIVQAVEDALWGMGWRWAEVPS